MRPLLSALLLMAASHAHGATLHLCPAAQAPASGVRAALAGGHTVAIADARASLPDCRALPLGVDASLVEALYPLPGGERPARTILLYGPAGAPRFAPSSHELPQPEQTGTTPARTAAPLRTNLLRDARVRAFGVEERVRVRHEDGRLRLDCAAGTRAAGVLVDGPWTLPLAALRLAADYSASAGFALQAADAASAAREAAHALGKLPASRATRSLALALPAALERDAWRQFVILCPDGAASLALDALALEPQPTRREAARSAWIWERAAWMEDAGALLAWAGKEGIGELFVVVPLDGARVREPARLAAFVRGATRAGIKVTAVEGDPHMVLPAQHAATVARARAYAAYNRAAAPAERLHAMQFDIEPYLLPDDVLAPAARERHYLTLARALHAAAGDTPLEFVVPFWWSGKTELLAGLAGSSDALTVMDYRTDPGQIVDFAVPFLDWGARHGKRVRIALEAGRVGAEIQRRYVRADPGEAGELLFADTGEAGVLVLLRSPVKQAAVPRYRLGGERPLDGSATSFHGNREALRALLPALERDLSAWPGFAGIALHGWR